MSPPTRSGPRGNGGASSPIDRDDDHGKRTSQVDFVGRFRVEYKLAGAVYRDVMRRANALRPPLGARERAVLGAVLELTTSYSKTVDSTTSQAIARLAYGIEAGDKVDGRDRERVREILNRIDALELIQMTPCGRGRSARIIVSVSSTTPHTSMGDYDDSGSQTPPAAGKNTPLEVQERPPVSAAHLEDLEVLLGKEQELASKEEVRVAHCEDCFKSLGLKVVDRDCTNPRHRGLFMAFAS